MKLGIVISGNSARRVLYVLTELNDSVARRVAGEVDVIGTSGIEMKEVASMSRLPLRSRAHEEHQQPATDRARDGGE